jgi:predicted porin
MPKQYCLAVLLVAVGTSVAEADQEVNSTDIGSAKNLVAAVTVSTSAATTASATTPEPAPAAKPVPALGAATLDLSMFKFGGFATLGYSHSSMDSGDYVLDSSMPKGAGRSQDWSASNNTRGAVHVTADFTPQVSAIFQVDSEYRSDGSYRPEVEWFNVKYAFTRDAYVRVGRIALPTFMDSDNRDVGYTFVWVHPPVDLYHQLSIPSSDGIDAMYRSEIGDAENILRAIFGTNKTERPTSITNSKEMWGLFDTLEYGPATFHISYQQRRSSTLNIQTGVTGEWTKNSDLSVGASYDPGIWFVKSEWIQRRSTTRINAMYASGGYRINKFTPYLTYSQNSPGTFVPGAPPQSAAAVERANRAQSTTGVGVRWDFMRNYDFKIQYDQVKLSDNSNGYLINVPKGVKLYGSKFHVISAVVDLVF